MLLLYNINMRIEEYLITGAITSRNERAVTMQQPHGKKNYENRKTFYGQVKDTA